MNTIKNTEKQIKKIKKDSIKKTQIKINHYYRLKFGNKNKNNECEMSVLPHYFEMNEFNHIIGNFSDSLLG